MLVIFLANIWRIRWTVLADNCAALRVGQRHKAIPKHLVLLSAPVQTVTCAEYSENAGVPCTTKHVTSRTAGIGSHPKH
jgi:hypothetical protein